ncbi:hypothetical protein MFIFM68171_05838 [Madurella fahalii]|uniref:Sacsin/Nov domain-containing protein n=1 Tax=Madurella fahalii TaxID=1157608 RepID=A0ABQ0GCY5_9PEZI
MDYPQTVDQARNHIRDIRTEKGLEGPQYNLRDMHAALDLLSEALYQKSTHFILELIQNADDNSYRHSSPSVDIRYKDRLLLFSCNEVGFSRGDVDAICRIGRSTKARRYQASGYIGEKGIGFKSVFRVSDIVWIKSGNYSFKFDKSQTLGMIAPIWAEFPCDMKVKPDHTNILLRLADSYNEDELIREIKSLDPRLLLFLRKLKEVRVSISNRGGLDWETAIKRTDQNDRSDGLRYVTLNNGDVYQQYMVTSFVAQDLARDPKRPGYTESELVLGFPVGFDNSPILNSQNVHAFLPIRDYGFKYIIQADLLLTASRENIDASSAWNLSLLRAIPSAMLSAVHQFNRGQLKYGWLAFLRRRPPIQDFFYALEDEVEALLAQHPILETAFMKWARPVDLFQVPARFWDTNEAPLLLSTGTTHKYLSSGYRNGDWDILKRLGVRQQTTEMFLDDLAHLVEHLPTEFRNRPDSWHASLSEVLSTILNQNKPVYRHKIAGMAIIPLRDGRWVPAGTENVFFEASAPALEIPPGIEVLLVDRSVSHNSVRVQLLVQLGVKRFSHVHACALIARMHANPSFQQQPDLNEPSHLVSQVRFLYHASWTNPEGREIYFVGRDGEVARGNKFYIDSTHPFAATSWPSSFRSKVKFLHADYVSGKTKLHESERWTAWLAEQCGVNIFPVLVTTGPGGRFELSEDFRLLMRVSDPRRILSLLRAQWSLYSKWIDTEFSTHDSEEQANNSCRSVLVEELGSLRVRCRDGTIAPLRETSLPLSDLPASLAAQLRLLDIEDPDSSTWHFLKHLGVGITFDNRVFLDQLRVLQGTDISLQDVTSLYRELERWGPAPEELRKTFEEEDLIYVPSTPGARGAWVNSTRCIWDGQWSLRRTACLKRYYPYLQLFFHRTLRIGDASLSTLVTEASMISPSDPLDYIAELFVSISGCLTTVLAVGELELVRGLKKSQIFPIRKKETPASAPFDELQAVTEKDVWLIADQLHLQQCFERRIDMLAFNAKDVRQMLHFLNEVGVSSRLLSSVASSLVEVEGGVKLLREYTGLMRSKAALIASLIHTTNPGQQNKQTLYRSLRSLEVFLVDRVVLRWTLRFVDGTEVAGSPDIGRIKTSNENGKFRIYLTSVDADPAEPPPELVEELLKLCGIKDAVLLQQVLMRSNISSLGEMLLRRGFTVEAFDEASSTREDQQSEIDVGAASFPAKGGKELGKPNQKQALSTTTENHDLENDIQERGGGLPDEPTEWPFEEERTLTLPDSGYGSASKAATTASKSVSNQESDHDDNASVVTGDLSLDLPPASADAYVDAFVKRILESIADFQADQALHSQIIQELPLLLRRFALRISLESGSADGKAVGVFTRKNKARITDALQQVLETNQPQVDDRSVDTDSTASQPHNLRVELGMTYDEKVRGWSTTEPESCEGMSIWEQSQQNIWDELHQREQDDADEGIHLSDSDTARINFVSNTTSFSWFLDSIRSRYQLDYSAANVLTNIQSSVALFLPEYRGNRALRRQQVTLWMDWNPKLFAEQQQYPGIHSIPSGLTITGSAMKSQLSTCRSYLKQTWPTTGEVVLKGLVELTTATNSDDIITIRLFDGLILTLQPADETVEVYCDGLFDSILEVVEILAWLGAALREASTIDKITYSVVDVRINEKAAELDSHPQLSLKFTEEELSSAAMPTKMDGACWLHGLFRNPVIAKGFPILTRQKGTSGLEVPLEVMAHLVHAAQLTLFNSRALIKGFNAALVPTAYEESIILWHFILNEDHKRLPYSDERIARSPTITLSEVTSRIQIVRHIVGWAPAAAYNIGSPTANYDIGWSSPDFVGPGCALEKFVISGGPGFITGGAEFSLGRKDRSPMIMRNATYFESLSGLSSSYVVLYDTRDQRAWLSNGLHTLLHLVRTSLREDQKGDFSDECLLNHSLLEEDPDQADPKATIRFLKNRRNLEQPVFPALDEIHTEQTTTAGGQSKMTHHRTSTTVRLKDRVTQVMEVLWQLIDHQATLDLYASGVPIRLPRSKLEGYRFMEVASRRQVTPRVVHLRAFGGAGKSWVDFIRAIRGVVLFGEGFGELISPSLSADTDTNATCSRWNTMPKCRDYLAVSAYDLNRIIHQEGSRISGPVKLAPGIFWNHSPGAFERCGCDSRIDKGKGPASILKAPSALFCRPCDRVQVLLPARLALIPRAAATPARSIDPNGAFIFGRSELFPWRWPDQGDPRREDPVEMGSSAAATEADQSVSSATASSSTRSPSSVGGLGGSVSITPPTTVSVSSPPSSQLGDSVATPGEMIKKSRPGRRGMKRVWESIRGFSSGG